MRRRVVQAVQWALFAVVLAFVLRHGWRLWRQDEIQQARLQPAAFGWLALSGVIYSIGWLPSVWFWRRAMAAMGGRVSFRDAARAYYCGHLGKYIPGKALVLVIRAAMVKDRGCPATAAALSAAVETLTMMGTGLALGLALAPLLFRDWLEANAPDWTRPWVFHRGSVAAVVVVATIVFLPVIARLLTLVARRTTPGGELQAPAKVPAGLLAAGCAAFLVSWWLQGVSLGLTLRAVGASPSAALGGLTWTGAMALSTALGFAVLFAPGGLGVREGILLGILQGQPGITPAAAVAATVLSRLVSFIAEIAISSMLFAAWRLPRTR